MQYGDNQFKIDSNMSTSTLLPRVELESAPNPTAAVIWMHGLGADGNDFAPLAPQLDLAGCQPIRFIFPHAPSIPVSINNGYAPMTIPREEVECICRVAGSVGPDSMVF